MTRSDEKAAWPRTAQDEKESVFAPEYDPPPARTYKWPIIVGIMIFSGLIVLLAFAWR
jgi:hypothetical protein